MRAAAKHCDVLSYNIYRRHLRGFKLPEGVDRPVLVGEFHFTGRPSPASGRLATTCIGSGPGRPISS